MTGAIGAAALFSAIAATGAAGAPAERAAPACGAGACKPSASLSISHKLRSSVAAGETGVVEIRVADRYDSGRLTLSASSDDGLDISLNSRSTSMDLASVGPQVWDIYFTAPADGVYHLTVLAVVAENGETAAARSVTFAVPVGDAPAAKKKASDAQTTATPSGERLILMEAEETISND